MEITLQIDDVKVRDLLISGMEGGSNYWAEFVRISGGTMRVKVAIDDEPKLYRKVYYLTLERLRKGLEVMAEKYPSRFGEFLAETDDAETSDVFIQCCCFGECIFG